MKQEEKQLLLKDLCARLPYNVVIRCTDNDTDYKCFLTTDILNELLHNTEYYNYKPYLRPLSSMTEEESDQLEDITNGWLFHNTYHDCETIYPIGQFTDDDQFDNILKGISYLNERHFDYRGLIPLGLALEAPEGMY